MSGSFIHPSVLLVFTSGVAESRSLVLKPSNLELTSSERLGSPSDREENWTWSTFLLHPLSFFTFYRHIHYRTPHLPVLLRTLPLLFFNPTFYRHVCGGGLFKLLHSVAPLLPTVHVLSFSTYITKFSLLACTAFRLYSFLLFVSPSEILYWSELLQNGYNLFVIQRTKYNALQKKIYIYIYIYIQNGIIIRSRKHIHI